MSKENHAMIARVVHEAIRAYKRGLGEDALAAWDDAPEWMREASLAAVAARVADPDGTAASQHEAWLEEKRRQGWRYGEVKDQDAKTHPLMIDYVDLPSSERRKDLLIQAIVDALTDASPD